MFRSIIIVTVFIFSIYYASPLLLAQRVKDLVEVEGARPNFITGEGIVVGLNGNGDSPKGITLKKIIALLRNQALWENVTAEDINTKNVALVKVEAELPPFQAVGTRIDVKISAIGDARSLAGGTLLITPLRSPRPRGKDKTVYALAWGRLIVEGDPRIGNLTSAYIPNGAVIEHALKYRFVREVGKDRIITLFLRKPDFGLANTIANAINQSALLELSPEEIYKIGGVAKALDAGTIRVRIPTLEDFKLVGREEDYPDFINQPVKFLSRVLDTPVGLTGEDKALVIINDTTKVISITGNVIVRRGRVQKGALTLKIPEDMLLQELLDKEVTQAMTPQDLIDFIKALDQAGLIKGKVISR